MSEENNNVGVTNEEPKVEEVQTDTEARPESEEVKSDEPKSE